MAYPQHANIIIPLSLRLPRMRRLKLSIRYWTEYLGGLYVAMRLNLSELKGIAGDQSLRESRHARTEGADRGRNIVTGNHQLGEVVFRIGAKWSRPQLDIATV